MPETVSKSAHTRHGDANESLNTIRQCVCVCVCVCVYSAVKGPVKFSGS